MGCSIGGRIVLDLAAGHADAVRGVIGLQSSAFVAPLLRLPNGCTTPMPMAGRSAPRVVSGLIAPTAPEADRWETLWHYMQGGPGVFRGDLHFYKGEGDLRPKLARHRHEALPGRAAVGRIRLFLPRRRTRCATAAAIPGAEAVIMKGLGHFPMSEDYAALRIHLLPALVRFAACRNPVAPWGLLYAAQGAKRPRPCSRGPIRPVRFKEKRR